MFAEASGMQSGLHIVEVENYFRSGLFCRRHELSEQWRDWRHDQLFRSDDVRPA
jgi:hypothetical protein